MAIRIVVALVAFFAIGFDVALAGLPLVALTCKGGYPPDWTDKVHAACCVAGGLTASILTLFSPAAAGIVAWIIILDSIPVMIIATRR